MTTTENVEPGLSASPPSPGPAVPLAALAGLDRLLRSPDGYERVIRYGDLIRGLHDYRAAVYDGHCLKVQPLGTFFRQCLRDSNCRAEHTPDNCRWATAEDQAYARYPLIADCVKEEA